MSESSREALEHLASGAAWMIALRWITRLLTFVAVIVLARLLAPEDFGVFAIGLIVLGLTELIGEGGIEFALIRKSEMTDDHLDSAWSLQIILGFVTGALVLVAAPFVAALFNEPRAELVLQILALRSILIGFSNIGIVYFLKDFDFHKEFVFDVARGLTESLVTISLAFLLRDFMALVLGSLFGAGLTVVMSYLAHPYRPKFSLAKAAEIWSFSGWIVIANLAEEAANIIGKIVVGIVAVTSTLGIYHMAANIGNTMFESTIFPLWRGLFPSYARIANKPRLLAKVFLVVFSWVSLVSCIVGFGLAAVSNELILALLGDKWADAIPLVPWLVLATAITAVVDHPLLVLTALGHSRLCAIQSVGLLLLLSAVLPVAALTWGIEAMAISLFVVTLLYLPLQIYYFVLHVPITVSSIVAAARRPLASGIIMFVAVRLTADALPFGALLSLVCEIAVGGVVFTGTIYLLWVLEGRPVGPESTLLGRLLEYVGPGRRR
jgi:lipopolysaccharide exporter